MDFRHGDIPSKPAAMREAHPASDPSVIPWAVGRMDEGLTFAVHHAGVSVFEQDADLCVRWALNMPDGWPDELTGKRDADFLPAHEASKLIQLKQRSLKGESLRCEIKIETNLGTHWFDVWVDPSRDDAGEIAGVVTTMVETTEQKRREQALRLLLREVSHRSKNLLAIIQSIATQTGRFSDTISVFLDRFRGRLHSLAASQDLVTSSNWRGADLRELITSQVGRYALNAPSRVRFIGSDRHLNPNAALHIGLALHELAANSLSFGALSQSSSQVSIECRPEEDAAGHLQLRLIWTEPLAEETLGSEDDYPIEKRFGSLALERVVPASLKGKAELRIAGRELRYSLLVPAASISAD